LNSVFLSATRIKSGAICDELVPGSDEQSLGQGNWVRKQDKKMLTVSPVGGFVKVVKTITTESLILAQNERWRRG
jgi:hypothetical protein